ncbi:MAG: universal stress protein [Burkholderiaceae bacterium]
MADRFSAAVIGIAATQPMLMDYGDGMTSAEVYELNRDQIAKEIEEVEAEFRRVLSPTVADLGWRSASIFTSLADYMAREARGADVVITGVDATSAFDNMRRVNTGDLIMQAGRPVLLVPTLADKPKLARMMIGWKDTRESRRAVVDALPLLRIATHVSLVEIRAEDERSASADRLADVAAWLKRHGVAAECHYAPSAGDDATALFALGEDHAIDLTVAGAYGHSRLREWVLGGVTRDLLVSVNRCSLVSH